MGLFRISLFSTAVLLPILVAGCGSVHQLAGSTPPTVSISANPTSINSGDSATLTISATNATQVTVTGSNDSSYTINASGGTQKVSPAATTTYTVTAVGAGGTVTAETVVTVNSAAAAPTVAISANPSTIASGSSSTLTITATNATQVTLAGSDGSSYALSPAGGTQKVSPSQTTTYTATATGAGGSAKNSTTVTVSAASAPAPTVTIAANPTSIASGSSSTLTVTATNATAVTVTGTDGSSYTLSPTGGTQSVKPSQTTTYTATATGAGSSVKATATVTVGMPATVSITAKPTTVVTGSSSTLTVTASNATAVTVTGTDGSSYTLSPTGGTQVVTPKETTTYTATATGDTGDATAAALVTVVPGGSVKAIQHVIFMMQENRTFDSYFGMLNVYRHDNSDFMGDDGNEYDIDGLVDCAAGSNPCKSTVDLTKTVTDEDDQGTSYPLFKFKSTCIDDDSSDWLASYGDVNRYDFLTTRPIQMNGFVHTAEGYANSCYNSGGCGGAFTDLTGERAMGYYDQDYLNYYYYMAAQFAVSDRWFSPVASKTIDNRIATMTGGTTQGLVKDPGGDDHLGNLDISNIFEELDKAGISWKIYYSVTEALCTDEDECPTSGTSRYPATTFSNISYSTHYLHNNASGCAAPTVASNNPITNDESNSFCIDPTHIAPISQFFVDLNNNALPSFAFIEPAYANGDEHPGSEQSILHGQTQMANIINSFMTSPEWPTSVFFFAYDEGGGPYDHVPPVPGHSNDDTSSTLGTYPDISSIAVNPDSYNPCLPPNGTATIHCDLSTGIPGANPDDAPAQDGFAAQLGFRLPNIVISPFTRRHYVSHIPMDHTAIIKFVESRFIGSSAHLTARDAAQPNLLDFFDFNNVPWETPPTPPTPYSDPSGASSCTPTSMGP